MADVTEIAPDVYRISTFVPDAGIQFCQFLILDEEPLLYETGYRGMFNDVRDAVARVVDPSSIKWIGFSHFEGDECGGLNEWLQIAPQATAVCSLVGAITSVQDFAIREPRVLQHGEILSTGKRRFLFQRTPHVPHCWDASLMFEETNGVLLASDLFFQQGDLEAKTESDIVERSVVALQQDMGGPLSAPIPYTQYTERILHSLADLNPRVIAAHHGSSFLGDGNRALRDLAEGIKQYGRLLEGPEAFGGPPPLEPPAAAG